MSTVVIEILGFKNILHLFTYNRIKIVLIFLPKSTMKSIQYDKFEVEWLFLPIHPSNRYTRNKRDGPNALTPPPLPQSNARKSHPKFSFFGQQYIFTELWLKKIIFTLSVQILRYDKFNKKYFFLIFVCGVLNDPNLT